MKKSSISGSTALSQMPKDVLTLGRALVQELDLDPGVDTLSRWMAHYIAELIQEAETATDEEKPAKNARCAHAILELWSHRYVLPNGKRPFEDFEPIFRAIESLDPANDTPRYFRSLRNATEGIEENDKIKKWFKIADDVDYVAKILISHCLAQAARTAVDKSKDWVKLAEAINMEGDIDLRVFQYISSETDLLKPDKPDDKTRKQIEGRIKRLNAFKKMADALGVDLKRQLEDISPHAS